MRCLRAVVLFLLASSFALAQFCPTGTYAIQWAGDRYGRTHITACMNSAGAFVQPANVGPGGNVPAWKKYALLAIANGVNTCASANNCWQVNGVYNSVKAAAATQDVVLFQLPAKGKVLDWRIKSNTACTGNTTFKTGLGITGSNVIFRALTYDLMAAVSDANVTEGPTAVPATSTHAAVNILASLIATVTTIDATAVGCAVDFWVLWGVLP